MKQEFLNLKPTHYLCPYCGEWHPWPENADKTLDNFDSTEYCACFRCGGPGMYYHQYAFYLEKCSMHYSTSVHCQRAYFNLYGEISIEDIIESEDEPIVTFEVPFTSRESLEGKCSCKGCWFQSKCNVLRLGNAGDGRNMKIKLGFKFDQNEYEKIH